jgi:Spy/CpxP family protein refolding chaperone
MKKLLIALIALVSISLTASAQTTPSVRQHPTVERKREAMRHHRHRKIRRMHRHHRMAQQLNLSDQQKAQAKVYRQDYKTQLLELNKKENITVKEQRDSKLALRKEEKAKMQSLLTPEQKSKMAQLKADDKAKAEQHYATRLDKMKAKLNLSDKQVTALQSQRATMMEKFKAIKEDDTMDRVAKKEKLMALKTQLKEDRKKIFTADQLKQMEEMKKARMEQKAVK